MTQPTRLPRLLIASMVALALTLPAVLPPVQQTHAGTLAVTAHHGASTRLARQTRDAGGPALPATLVAPPGPGAVASSIPITVQVPAGNVAYLGAHAAGVQIYTCTTNGTTFAWSSSVPAATLFNAAGHAIATHYAGPTWQATDGSTVVGHKLASATVAPDAIPWLLLSAASTTHGPTGGNTLSDTSYIQRLSTRGGLTPPASGCAAGTVGTTVSVPYTALYVFWQLIALVTSVPHAAVGQSITVTGTNFTAGEAVQVSWDYTGTTPLATATADISGTFVASFTIPVSLAGMHTLLAIGQTSGTTAFASVQVTPRLSVAPAVGQAGSQVVASGDGFGAKETVTLTWDSLAGAVVGTTTSDPLGSFGASTAVTFTVPANATTGRHLVFGAGQTSGARAVAGFMVR